MNRHLRYPLLNFVSRHRLNSAMSLCLILAYSTYAFSCDFCLRLPNHRIDLGHAQALEIAIATWTAAEAGDIDLNPMVAVETTIERHRQIELSKATVPMLVASWIRSRPAQRHPALRCMLEISFVDVDETCWLDIRLGEVLSGDPRLGPIDGRLVTTKAGFYELMKSGFESCAERQFVVLDKGDSVPSSELVNLFPARTKLIASAQMAR